VNVFVTGGTGYLGAPLIRVLIDRGHAVTALARRESAVRLPAGCRIVIGDALDRRTFEPAVAGCDTFVQLVGVPHPSPAKAEQFRTIDLVSARASIAAASAAGVRHFIYVSVAQPAPIMKAYLATRAEAESALRATGMPATVLRPWYVLGPGHHWPYLIMPLYWMLELLPMTRAAARRLALVTHTHMLDALLWAVENPADDFRIIDAAQIKRGDFTVTRSTAATTR
jgi:uncharacterized protein YbjT (DUF2867 family)